MKALFLFLLMILFLQINISAQVFNGDLELTTQAEIDNFNYTSITGDLTIDEATLSNITNLNGLSELTSIGGEFIIYVNRALTNIDGLSSLSSVGESTSIYNNDALPNIDGLINLNFIGGFLSISDNEDLINIDALQG